MSISSSASPRASTSTDNEAYWDSKVVLCEEHRYAHCCQRARHREGRNCWITLTLSNILLFMTSLVVLILNQRGGTQRNASLRSISTYSPVLDNIDVRLIDSPINGSLLPGKDASPWRGVPSPETAAAWNQFELIRTMRLTRQQIISMGKDPDNVAKFDERFGLGDDAYVGALDIFHQVHCLNLLRQGAFNTYGLSSSSPVPHVSKLDWIHLQHCTDMLMQHLLCNADVGMITYQWREDNDHPFPDFSVNRVCRDWTQLAEYRDAHAVDLETYANYTKPEEVQVIKETAEYWALMKEIEADNATSSHN